MSEVSSVRSLSMLALVAGEFFLFVMTMLTPSQGYDVAESYAPTASIESRESLPALPLASVPTTRVNVCFRTYRDCMSSIDCRSCPLHRNSNEADSRYCAAGIFDTPCGLRRR